MKSIREIENLKGKRVLVRVDFNLPIKNGIVEDDFRVEKALPTIKFLVDGGALVTLVTHLGKDGSESLDPIKKRFFELSKIPESQISFFDNVRKYKGEEENDPEFAKELARYADIYVNEAFPVSHRTHSSIVGVPKILPSYAGFQLEEEVKNLSRALVNPEHPFLFILGGAKFSTKLPLIEKYLELADHVFVGGALSDDFLKAEGYEVGKSLVSAESFGIEKFLNHPKLILPVDVRVMSDGQLVTKKVQEVQKDEIILDIGEETIKKLEPIIKNSKFILWNGPLGKFEDGGAEGTEKILTLVADSGAESILGGGETVVLVRNAKMEDRFTFVSTGGGATLDFLVDGTLPGIDALMK